MTNDIVTRIIAIILRDGYIYRHDCPEMMNEEVQTEVRRRLKEVDLELVLSLHSDAWGACFNRNAILALDPDWLTNQGFKRNTLALIVVLWTKLILPKRLVSDSNDRETGQQPLPGMELALEEVRQGNVLSMSLEQLHADFGNRFGSRTTLRILLGQLKKFGIVEYERIEEIRAGPMLDVIIPGPEMRSYIEREIREIMVRDSDITNNSSSEAEGGNS